MQKVLTFAEQVERAMMAERLYCMTLWFDWFRDAKKSLDWIGTYVARRRILIFGQGYRRWAGHCAIFALAAFSFSSRIRSGKRQRLSRIRHRSLGRVV